jgi:hypothetical protein
MSAFLKKERVLARKKNKTFHLSLLQKQLIVGFFVFTIVGIVVATVWYTTRIDSLQIKHVAVVGGETIPHQIIKDKANTALSGTYLALVPKRFIPFYPKKKVAESVRQVSRVKNAHVELTEDQTLTIVFDEYVPSALWCAEPESESCLFMDHLGYAFAEAPTLEGSAFPRYIEEKAEPTVDTQGFDSAFIKDTEAFASMLETQLSLYVTHIYKRGNYDVEYTISGGGVIKVSQSISMQESFDNLQAILLSEEFKHIEPGAFQYIDLRFGDKIFVNEEAAAPKQATTTSDEVQAASTEY